MFEYTSSKKTTKTTKQELNIKNYEKISFVIISPCVSYKYGKNKRSIFVYIDGEPIILKHNEQICKNFPNSECLLVSGQNSELYRKIKNGFSVIENSLYMVTGECEQIRLGIQAARNNKIVFLKEKSLLNISNLSNKEEPYIVIGEQKNNPGCIINNDYVTNISYGLSNYFENCFMPQNDKIEQIYKFCSNESNKNKMMHECLNNIIGNREEFKAIRV